MNGFMPLQPSLLNAYKDLPVYIVHPQQGALVRFLPRNENFSSGAVHHLTRKGIQVYVRLEDHRLVSGKVEKALIEALQGRFDEGKAALVKGLTIQMMHEYFAAQAVGVDDEGENLAKLRELERMVDAYVALIDLEDSEALLRLMHKVMAKDLNTASHSVNVMILTLRYLEKERRNGEVSWVAFALPREKQVEMEDLERFAMKQWALAALLHDIGKVLIPEGILKARRRLTLEEYKIMKLHVEYGWNILSRIAPHYTGQPVIQGGLLHHHERKDGSGYPLRIKDISVPGQVIGILDCYEALTTDKRPYREALPPLEALKILRHDTMEAKFEARIYTKLVELVANGG